MMHKDMRTIETAAQATAVYYDPAKQENAMLRTGFFVTAGCIFIAAIILMIA